MIQEGLTPTPQSGSLRISESNTIATRPPLNEKAIFNAALQHFTEERLSELDNRRSELRSAIFKNWDLCVSASARVVPMTPIKEFIALRRVLAGFGYTPKGILAQTQTEVLLLKKENIGAWLDPIVTPIARLFDIDRPVQGFTVQRAINQLTQIPLKEILKWARDYRSLAEAEMIDT